MIEAGIYGNVNSGPDPQPRGARVVVEVISRLIERELASTE